MAALCPQQIELALAESWPALVVVRDGGWEARFARGYSGRSNSIQVLDPADDAAPEARLARLCALYREQGLTPMVKLTPLTGPATRRAAEALGWHVHHDSLVLAAPASRFGGLAMPEGVEILPPASPGWLDAQTQLQGLGEAERAALSALVERVSVGVGFVLRDEAGAPVASALGLLGRGVAVPVNVIVAEKARGRGHGRTILEAMLAWSLAEGARVLAIQVLRSNLPAVSLYRSAGFADCYTYHYLREMPA